MGTGTVSYAATRKCTAPGMLPSMSQWKPEKSCLFSHQVFLAVCLVVSCTAKKVCMWCVHSGRHQVSSHIPSSSSSFLLKREQFLGSRLNDKVQKGGSAAGLSPTICPSKSITLSASTNNPRSKKIYLALTRARDFSALSCWHGETSPKWDPGPELHWACKMETSQKAYLYWLPLFCSSCLPGWVIKPLLFTQVLLY